MAVYSIKLKGFTELETSLRENKTIIAKEVSNFIQRAMARLDSGIKNNPWKVGASGGGSPVASRNGGSLRASHQKDVTPWSGRIYPTQPYAVFVHEGTYKMKARPWLDFVLKEKEPELDKLQEQLLEDIIKQL